jgi:hypothetical protein
MDKLNYTESDILLRKGMTDTDKEYPEIDKCIDLLIDDWLGMYAEIERLTKVNEVLNLTIQDVY